MIIDQIFTSAVEYVMDLGYTDARFCWFECDQSKGVMGSFLAVFNLPPDKTGTTHVLEVRMGIGDAPAALCLTESRPHFIVTEKEGCWAESLPMCPYFPLTIEGAKERVADAGYNINNDRVVLCHVMSTLVAQPAFYFSTDQGLAAAYVYTGEVKLVEPAEVSFYGEA